MLERTLMAATLAMIGFSTGPANADTGTFRASGPSPYLPDCNGVVQTGTLYTNAEVEPFVAVNPRNRLNLVGVWQQDRWSNGGAQGLGTAFSVDGGVHWHRVFQPYTRCAGGNASNGGDYERGSDPWVSISPNGVVHQGVLGLSFNAAADEPVTALLASRSLDGGLTWSLPATLQADTAERFNDKNSLTADPTDSRYVYAVWDRLSSIPNEGAGPTLLARSVDNGKTWEPARIIYDPGTQAQTIGNRIEVLPNGVLVNLFTQIDFVTGAATLQVIRSMDKGDSWSAPIMVADLLAIGAFDPETGTPIRDGAILAQLTISRQGAIYVTWQDARFSDGAMDGIALSRSTDGGLSWSEPVQINRNHAVQAFTPTPHVRDDGTVGVSYYDLRSNTPDPDTLWTDAWLTRTRFGNTWHEARVARPFDLSEAPFAGGYFLGDYQGLTSIGPLFIPFFAKSKADEDNRNDIYAQWSWRGLMPGGALSAPAAAEVAAAEARLPSYTAQGRAVTQVSPAWRAATWRAFERSMRARVPNWDAMRAGRAVPQF
ncbi:sialidase family protein [Ideonella sp. YS5]|uniref:sialidase family protein n=1 Tax=Ideonella sp. YS5 TaxID=3453714 RepID=UPI003EF06327